MKDLINELIGEAVLGYKTFSYKYLDEVKTLVFTYLIDGFTYEEFNEKLKELNEDYGIKESNRKSKDYKEIRDKTYEKASKGERIGYEISEEEISRLKFKLDEKSGFKARQTYIRRIRDYYKNTSKTLQKDFIIKDKYIESKVDKFDKVEKVVPYYSRDTGKIVAWHDIADYNSMLYNTNLTSVAWNSTFEACQILGEDKVYVEPHAYSCELCQEFQGKWYSISDKPSIYPKLESILWYNRDDGTGIKHPNCKHILMTDMGQQETNDYTGAEWVERYDASQKLNALNLKESRLETDKGIYAKLGNQSKVDEIDSKIALIEKEKLEQKRIMKF